MFEVSLIEYDAFCLHTNINKNKNVASHLNTSSLKIFTFNIVVTLIFIMSLINLKSSCLEVLLKKRTTQTFQEPTKYPTLNKQSFWQILGIFQVIPAISCSWFFLVSFPSNDFEKSSRNKIL